MKMKCKEPKTTSKKSHPQLFYLIDCADNVHRNLPARWQHRHQHP